MKLSTDKLKVDGFSDAEIQQIQNYCDAVEKKGTFSREAALVKLAGKPELCCRTIAEILDQLRPGCWIDREEATPATRGKRRRKSRQETDAIREIAMKDDDGNLIKVHYTYPRPQPGWASGEFLFARRINKNTAQIDSIPFGTGRLASGDLVRFNKDREITKILEHVAKTRSLMYADHQQQPLEEITQRYAEVRNELKQYDIYTEGMIPGICAISVPKDVEDDELESIANRLDADVVFHDDEIEDD